MNFRKIGLAALPLFAFAFAACTSDEDSSTAAPATPAKTITEVVVEDARFGTLEAAVKAAGLAGTLAGKGPYTVFAPTDAAFAALPAGTLETLLADPSGDLKDILLYHVVAADVKAAQVVTLDKASTALGKDVAIAVKDGKVTLNGNVQVTITDIATANGTIHVIDGVLLPPQ